MAERVVGHGSFGLVFQVIFHINVLQLLMSLFSMNCLCLWVC